MKAPIVVTSAILTTICLATPAVSANSEHTTQLLATKQCQNCDLSGAGLFLANLSGANLSAANLSGANLSRANLSGANLSGANLSGASLFGANLTGANLTGANLSVADLRDTYLVDVDLASANLVGASLQGAIGIPAQVGTAEEFYNLGFAQGQKGDPKGAIEYFTRALNLNSKYADAYLARGVARYRLSDRSGALQDAQQAERLFLAQGNSEGYKIAQTLIQDLQTPQNASKPKSKSNFMNFLSGISSLLLQFFLF